MNPGLSAPRESGKSHSSLSTHGGRRSTGPPSVGRRTVVVNAIEELLEIDAEAIRNGYRPRKPNLPGVGKQLFDWLDDRNEQWMAKIHQGGPSAAICFDVDGELRDLPWELLCVKGAFLGIRADRPFTPIRRAASAHRVRQPRDCFSGLLPPLAA